MNPLWVSKTGLEAQQTRLTAISNNLANVNTDGFKRDRVIFEDLMYQNIRQPGGQSSQDTQLPSGLMLGTGVRTVATQKIHSQGGLMQTGNTLDMAIQGRGYFQILKPNGDLTYTRNGAFQKNSDGKLVTANGYLVQPEITIPPNARSITIGNDGIVTAMIAGSPAAQQLGQLQLADFVNPSGLQPIGENLFLETPASGSPVVGNASQNNMGSINQNSLEASNVNVVEEMVNMIETQRAYEMNSKAIQTMDQMLQYVNQQL
jgi:flagellar basal-body rod protein FlgG